MEMALDTENGTGRQADPPGMVNDTAKGQEADESRGCFRDLHAVIQDADSPENGLGIGSVSSTPSERAFKVNLCTLI